MNSKIIENDIEENLQYLYLFSKRLCAILRILQNSENIVDMLIIINFMEELADNIHRITQNIIDLKENKSLV